MSQDPMDIDMEAFEKEFLAFRNEQLPLQEIPPNRRKFMAVAGTGAGLVVSVANDVSIAQIDEAAEVARLLRQPPVQNSIASRIVIEADGMVTVLCGKVEFGQGSRTQVTQAAAEELGLPVDRIRVIMGDTLQSAGDGGTFASFTTSQTIPRVRSAAASARNILFELAAEKLQVKVDELKMQDGKVVHASTGKSVSLGELAKEDTLLSKFNGPAGVGITVRPTQDWEVLGKPRDKVGGEDVVTGNKQYPSDIRRPGMLYGKVLRAPAFGATLESVDLGPAKAMSGVVAVQDGSFVGCAAPSTHLARKALDAIAKTAKWKMPDVTNLPTSETLSQHLKSTVQTPPAGGARGRGGAPGGGGGRGGGGNRGSIDEGMASASKKLEASYDIAYIAHAPMEPRAAVAEWKDGKITVWQGSQSPDQSRREVAGAFQIQGRGDEVRIIVPDTGGGFGGKHSGDVAVEAARLAKAAQRPVSLLWTREEEFTWAYFRPAGLAETRAGLDPQGNIVAWEHKMYHAGAESVNTPYRIANVLCQSVQTSRPLPNTGAYRSLAAAANTFARESFMDELAKASGTDPLVFRLKHLDAGRLRNVIVAAAEKFGWDERMKKLGVNEGIGFACGPEKGSYVAACAHVTVNRVDGSIKVNEVCQAYECGPIQNPTNLMAQVEGGLVMGLGGALTEKILFAEGKILNPRFSEYEVPRMKDLPKLDIVLLNPIGEVDATGNPITSVGAGETPIIAIAPAIANAVYRATGIMPRSLPIDREKLKLPA